jgi:hypothetical protein
VDRGRGDTQRRQAAADEPGRERGCSREAGGWWVVAGMMPRRASAGWWRACDNSNGRAEQSRPAQSSGRGRPARGGGDARLRLSLSSSSVSLSQTGSPLPFLGAACPTPPVRWWCTAAFLRLSRPSRACACPLPPAGAGSFAKSPSSRLYFA